MARSDGNVNYNFPSSIFYLFLFQFIFRIFSQYMHTMQMSIAFINKIVKEYKIVFCGIVTV